jgi:peptide/nickel transport system ATP-binding protein
MSGLLVRDLRVTLPGPDGPVAAVRGLSLAVPPGAIVGLVGASGCGKSVSLLAIARLLPKRRGLVVSGEVLLDGRDLLTVDEVALRDVRGRRIGVVFQDPAAALDPLMTIGAQLDEALAANGAAPAAIAGSAQALLEEVGLHDIPRMRAAWPHELSGGQQQRVVIALALAGDPTLLLADEPTTALDPTVQAQVLRLLRDLVARRGMGLLLVSHDLPLVAGYASEVLVMHRGAVVDAGPPRAVLGAPRHAVSRAMVEAAQLARAPAPAPAPARLRVHELRIAYRRGAQTVNAVQGVGFEIAAGEALGLVGESGSGKSSIARAVAGLMAPLSGSIALDGASPGDPRAWARRCQLVAQDPLGALNPRHTARRALEEPFRIHRLPDAEARIAAVLEEVGLGSELLGRYPTQLSGGQRQRLCIARALLLDPAVLVCDEPVTALDAALRRQVLELLAALCAQRGLALLMISHDFAAVRALCPSVVVLDAGAVIEAGPTEDVMRAPRHARTAALVAALPPPLAA